MSATTAGWLVLLCPLRRDDRDRARLPVVARPHRGLARHAGDRAVVRVRGDRVGQAARPSPGHRQLTSTLWNYDVSAGVDAKLQILVDPLSVFMILVVSGVSTLIHLYSVTYMTATGASRATSAT